LWRWWFECDKEDGGAADVPSGSAGAAWERLARDKAGDGAAAGERRGKVCSDALLPPAANVPTVPACELGGRRRLVELRLLPRERASTRLSDRALYLGLDEL
jgi:hypothetical protein